MTGYTPPRAHNLESLTMGRPKQPRSVDGIVLSDNLYPITGKPGRFRYRRVDGTFKRLKGILTPEQANAIANQANAHRDDVITKKPPSTQSWQFWIERYVAWAEQNNPKLLEKESWRNRKYEMFKFAREFAAYSVSQLTRNQIKEWWDELTHYQQKSRFAAFRKLFNYLMGEGLCSQFDYNPFTTADDRPRLYLKSEPTPTAMRLDIDTFWRIYKRAGSMKLYGLQITMGIMLNTMWRPSDVVSLKLKENIDGDYLQTIISKSEKLRGEFNAPRLKWNYRNNPFLQKLVKRGRELALVNESCPYLASHMPKMKRMGGSKDHVCQLTVTRVSDQFTEVVVALGLDKNLPEGKTPSTLYEVKSLASAKYREAGYDRKQIQEAMGHSKESTTAIYQDGHDLPYEEMHMQLNSELLGGEF